MGLLDPLSRSEAESTETEQTESGGRRLVRFAAGIGAFIIGVLTLRKVRNRRKRN